jgi:hypothetical protein
MSFEQEVIGYVPGEMVRMKNVTHGVLWDSTFAVRANNSACVLTLTMDADTGNPLKRFLMRLISPSVQRALDKDLGAVAAYAERLVAPASSVRWSSDDPQVPR